MKSKTQYEIVLVAPPWWLIPSRNILTATEHLIEDYSYHLRQRKYNNVIFCRQKDNTDTNDICDTNNYNNDHIYTKVSKLDRYIFKKFYSIFNKNNYHQSLIFYLSYILKVSLKIRKYKIKKVIVFQTFSFCYWIKLFNPDCQVIFHIGSHELSKTENYYNYGLINDKLARRVFPKIDKVITVSKLLQNDISNRFPKYKHKCQTIYPGIDITYFSKNNNTEPLKHQIILFTGRVVPEKGVHLLVNAFKELLHKYNNIELYIAGAHLGPNMDKDYIKSLKHPKIKFLGLLPRHEIPTVIKKASIFVHPVIMEEPLGLAPLEAMAGGLPVVVSDVKSGYQEIISKRDGYYFKNNDYKDLKKALDSLLSNKHIRQELIYNGRSTIKQKLSWDKCIHHTIRLYENKNR